MSPEIIVSVLILAMAIVAAAWHYRKLGAESQRAAGLQASLTAAQQKVASLEGSAAAAQQKVVNLEGRLVAAQQEVARLQKENQTITNEEARNRLAALSKTIREHTSNVKKNDVDLGLYGEHLKFLIADTWVTVKEARLKGHLAEFEEHCRIMRDHIDRSEEHLKVLKGAIAVLDSDPDTSPALRHLEAAVAIAESVAFDELWEDVQTEWKDEQLRKSQEEKKKMHEVAERLRRNTPKNPKEREVALPLPKPDDDP